MADLSNIIGLTESDCNCLGIDAGELAALNASDSGLYLTDHDGGFPLLDRVYAAIDCNSPDNVLGIMSKARTSAVQAFTTDVSAALMSIRSSKDLFTGNIGRPLVKPVFQVPAGANSIGVEIVLPVRRGQSLVIDKIYTGFATFADFSLSVWSNDPTFSADAIPISGGVNGKINEHDLSTPLVLPQYSDAMSSERRIIYRLYYTPVSNPYALELRCCGQSASYRGYMAVGGFVDTSDRTTTVLDDTINAYSTSMGLAFHAYQTCGVTQWLCETTQLGGYDLQGLIAQAVRYKGAINLMHQVLDTQNINAYTMLGREQIYGRRNHYQKRYGEIVQWIAENVPPTASDCLGCTKKIIELATVPL